MCLFSSPTDAQSGTTPVGATLSVNVRVVAFDAIVRDRHDTLVPHLRRDDFSLLVDGTPQSIRYFSEDSDLPLTIGLMVDTSGSQRPYFSEEQAASRTFLTNMLTEPQDEAAILHFDTDVLPLQGLTHSLPLLSAALGRLGASHPPQSSAKGGTLLFDGLCAANLQLSGRAAVESRRAIILFTDGEENGSRVTRDEAIACAQRYGITVYVAFYSSRENINDERFDPRVPVFPHEHLPGRTNVERIARSTGGRVFLVSHQSIESIYAAIQAELRSQYRLGFTPPAAAPGSFHGLELKLRDKHLKVQTRMGYYAP